MKFLKKISKPPVFDDEIKTQQAYMLHIILWALIFVPIPYVIYTSLFSPDTLSQALMQTVFGEVINILLMAALYRGYVQAASLAQIGAFWLFFTATAFTGNGVQGEAYLIGYTLIITIAGILFGGRGAFAFSILSLVSGAVMAYLQTEGRLDTGLANSPFSTWVVSLLLFPIDAILQQLASRRVKKALVRATANEERYRLISQVSSDYTFSTALDADGNMYLNWVAGAFEEITGYSYDEYVASGGWAAHLHPDDIKKDEQDTEILKTNKPIVAELRTYKKDRQLRWVRVYAHPVWNEKEKRLTGIVGAVQDITEQKQAEEALRESETIYQKAIELAGAVPYHQIFDEQGNIIYKFMGKGIRQITGYGPDEFTDDLWGILVQERHLLEDLEPYDLDDAIQQARTGKTPIWKCEHLIKNRNGELRWVYEAAVDLRDENGIAYGSIGFYQDITSRKQSEELETKRREMLEKVISMGKQVTETQDLQNILERIWHGIHDEIGFDRLAIFLYDQSTNTVNGTLGTDNNGNIVEEWEYQRALDQERPTSFTRALEQPNGLFYTSNFSTEFEIPEGHEMYKVKDFAAVSAWAGDKPVAIIVVDNLPSGRPFTQAQLEFLRLFAGYAGLAIENSHLNAALQTELEQRKNFIDELENKNAELERFTYTVSHDLKSPLVTITGFLGFLEKDIANNRLDRVKSSVLRISGAAKKMQKLLNDLLELSRIGRIMNEPEDIPFGEIVNEAIDHVRGRLDKVEALVEIQRDLPVIHGDRVRLVEVIQNLVENSVKYSSPNVKLRVEIGMQSYNEENCPIFYVRDNGIGIEPKYHERIFGLFNKLDAQTDGTGIGLSLVKRIIEVHGGHIWVESEKDQGATFYFSLPTPQSKE